MQGGPINPGVVYGSADDLNAQARERHESVATDYDSGDVDVLLIALVNNIALARKAAEWLDPSYLINHMKADHWQVAIWLSLRDILLSAQEDPTPGFLARSAYHAAIRQYGDESIAAAASTAVSEIAGLTPIREISEKILHDLYAKCVMSPNVNALLLEARDSSDWSKIFTQIDDLHLQRSKSLVDEEATAQVDAFSVLDKLDEPIDEDEQETQPRLLTGVPYIDALHGGHGIYRGFTTLIAGETGGGKTIVNYELSATVAGQHYSVGMFPTEENPATDAESKARLFAACTDVTVDEWKEARCDPRRLKKPLQPAQLDRLRKMRQYLKIYRIDPINWSSLEAELENYYLTHDNTMHDLVIIDWAGPLAVEMVATNESQSMHDALERVCLWATQRIARRYQCAVVVFHQLKDQSIAKKGIYGQYGKGDTQNCGKMSHHCAAFHVIAPKNSDGRARYCAVKARFDKEGVETLIQLDYPHGRFFDISSTFEIRSKNIVPKKSDDAKGMPHARRKVGEG